MTSRSHLAKTLGFALLAVAMACHGKESRENSPEGPARVVVTVAPVSVRSVQRTVDVVGTLHGDEEATISAKVSGRVVEVLRDVGDSLAAGEPLARIDPTDYRLIVSQREAALAAALAEIGLDRLPENDFDAERVPTVVRARAEFENATARFERAKAMHEEKPPTISEQDYFDQKTELEVARSSHEVALLNARSLLAQARTRASEFAQARQALADATVVAPGDSRDDRAKERRFAVASRLVSTGEYVREGTPMFRIVDPDPIKFRAAVPERYVADIRVGQSVDVSVQAYEDKFHGAVARVSPQINAANRTFQIEIAIQNQGGRLKPGGFATGAIQTKLEENVIFLPQEAVITFVGVTKTFAIKSGVAVQHRIATGVQDGDFVEAIGSGLSPSDEVAVSGVSRLADGVAVEVKAAEDLSAPPIDPASAAPGSSSKEQK